MRRTSVVVLAAITTVTVFGVGILGAEERLVFTDTFSGNLSAWEPHGGTWTIESGKLKGYYNHNCGSTTCPQAELLLKKAYNPSTPDWKMEVDFFLIQYPGYYYYSRAYFSMYNTANDKENIGGGGHWETYSAIPSTESIFKWRISHYSPWGPYVKETVYLSWSPKSRNTMAVEKRGNQLTLFVNGRKIGTVDNPRVRTPSQLGLHIYGVTLLDNFKLYEISDDPPQMSGLNPEFESANGQAWVFSTPYAIDDSRNTDIFEAIDVLIADLAFEKLSKLLTDVLLHYQGIDIGLGPAGLINAVLTFLYAAEAPLNPTYVFPVLQDLEVQSNPDPAAGYNAPYLYSGLANLEGHTLGAVVCLDFVGVTERTGVVYNSEHFSTPLWLDIHYRSLNPFIDERHTLLNTTEMRGLNTTKTYVIFAKKTWDVTEILPSCWGSVCPLGEVSLQARVGLGLGALPAHAPILVDTSEPGMNSYDLQANQLQTIAPPAQASSQPQLIVMDFGAEDGENRTVGTRTSTSNGPPCEANLRFTDGGTVRSIKVPAQGIQSVNLGVINTSSWDGSLTASCASKVFVGFTETRADLPPACTSGSTTLCLNKGRFRVDVEWKDFKGNHGSGHAVPLSADTGYFWFFNEENVELVVKVLDGTAVNESYWVFYGALSNVEYSVRVIDTETGAVREYKNPSGVFASAGHTRAFSGSTASATGTAVELEPFEANGDRWLSEHSFGDELLAVNTNAACTATSTSLCLNNGRFRVNVDWRTQDGRTGQGQAVSLTGDTGYFWFFDDDNVELVLKVLDGRPVNGHYWVFYGALSNVQYTITVTDTETLEVKTYTNPQGQMASVGDTRAFAVP